MNKNQSMMVTHPENSALWVHGKYPGVPIEPQKSSRHLGWSITYLIYMWTTIYSHIADTLWAHPI